MTLIRSTPRDNGMFRYIDTNKEDEVSAALVPFLFVFYLSDEGEEDLG